MLSLILLLLFAFFLLRRCACGAILTVLYGTVRQNHSPHILHVTRYRDYLYFLLCFTSLLLETVLTGVLSSCMLL